MDAHLFGNVNGVKLLYYTDATCANLAAKQTLDNDVNVTLTIGDISGIITDVFAIIE